jgi:hypothetical protein
MLATVQFADIRGSKNPIGAYKIYGFTGKMSSKSQTQVCSYGAQNRIGTISLDIFAGLSYIRTIQS